LLLKGVPVNSNLKLASNYLTLYAKIASSFFILWASSITKTSQGIFFKIFEQVTAE
jgi:hypothetical protein